MLSSLPFLTILNQRMTLLVPDKAQARGLVLTSLIALLSALQRKGVNHNHNHSRSTRSNNNATTITTNNNSNHYTTASRRVTAKYFAFLTKLARSNKTSHRAYR